MIARMENGGGLIQAPERLAPCALMEICKQSPCPLKTGGTCQEYASEEDLNEMAECDKRIDAWINLKEYEMECKLAMKRSEK